MNMNRRNLMKFAGSGLLVSGGLSHFSGAVAKEYAMPTPPTSPNRGLRDKAQKDPAKTYIICIKADRTSIGGYNVESAGTLNGDASDQDIMNQINSGNRSQLPYRDNPFDLTINAATKIVFHLEEANWAFTDVQFKLTKNSQNETSPGRNPHYEFGGLGWVIGDASGKTISVVDTHRRMMPFEYGLFISIQQGSMETTIEIDPKIFNGR